MAKTPPKKKKGLTPKQEKACRKYVKTSNKTQSYKFAYNTSRMKPVTINRLAHRLFKQVNIGTRVQQLRDELAKRNNISEDRVLEEYAKLGFLDPRRFYDKEGSLIPIHELPADVAATLAGMDVQTIYTKDGDMMGDLKKIKFADKKAALDSISRTLGMFIDRHEISGSLTLEDKLRKIRG